MKYLVTESNRHGLIINFLQEGLWWWSSGHHPRLLLQLSKFQSRWQPNFSVQYLKMKINEIEVGVGTFVKTAFFKISLTYVEKGSLKREKT